MKLVAFKRATTPEMHPLFITEYHQVQGDVPEGYESMIEAHFEKEFALNEERQKAHEVWLRDQEAYKKREESELAEAEVKSQKEAEREFRQFIQWRKNNRKIKER